MTYRLLLAAALLAFAVACSSARSDDSASFTLLVTGDNWGEIAPCG